MVRAFARSRAFPILAWAYLVALGAQVFFAGMYVFVGASNIELHRNMAHVIGALTLLLIVSVFLGRVSEKRLMFGVLGLLVVQGMLVHVGQWFGLWTIAALHPVNALVLTYASLALAKRSVPYWGSSTRVTGPAVPGHLSAQGSTA
jgi:heme A synthase